MEITIRHARRSDAQVISHFNTLLARETEDMALQLDCVGPGVEAVLADPRKGRYFLAETGGAVVGQLMLTREWSDWRNGEFWWVQSVYVHKDHRGKGVLRHLLAHVWEMAREDPIVCGLRLYVAANNPLARRAYRRLGLGLTPYLVMEQDLRTLQPPPVSTIVR